MDQLVYLALLIAVSVVVLKRFNKRPVEPKERNLDTDEEQGE